MSYQKHQVRFYVFRLLPVFAILLAFAGRGMTQPPHRDTAWGFWPDQPYLNQILQAPVTTGASQAINIVPNSRAITFDKQIKIKSAVGSRIIYQCLYLNTTDGLVGYLKPGATGPQCDITPDVPGFHFAIIGLKGNIYNYETIKGNHDVIEHWVSTGNSQASPYQFASSSASAVMHRRGESKYYCGGKIKAVAYKFDVNDALRYMFGKNFPPDIQISANKYLGNLGIGYQYTDKGLYIIMEMQTRNYDCEILDIQDVSITFNPVPFRVKEDEFQQKTRNDFTQQHESLDREEAEIQNSGECVTEKMASLNFKRQVLQKQEDALNTVRSGGNVYQDRQVQMAYMTMMDPLLIVQQSILDTKVSICGVEHDMQKHPDDYNLPERHTCLQDLLGKLTTAEQQMRSIDRQYANQPAKARAEKSRIYLQVSNSSCN